MITWDQFDAQDNDAGHRVAYKFTTFLQGMAAAGNAAARNCIEVFANCRIEAKDGTVLTDNPAWLKAHGGLMESEVAR